MDSADGILWPFGTTDAQQTRIRSLLQERDYYLSCRGMRYGFKEVRAPGIDFTAFYYVNNMGPVAKAAFASNAVPEVSSDPA